MHDVRQGGLTGITRNAKDADKQAHSSPMHFPFVPAREKSLASQQSETEWLSVRLVLRKYPLDLVESAASQFSSHQRLPSHHDWTRRLSEGGKGDGRA